jgi:hypothetical protein
MFQTYSTVGLGKRPVPPSMTASTPELPTAFE